VWPTSTISCPPRPCTSPASTFCPSTISWLASGTQLDQVKSAQSHVMALGQCRKFLREHKLEAVIGADTAGSARQIAERGDPAQAAIASSLAAEVYGWTSWPRRH
jgi:prephenate dehydratase